MLKQTNQIIVCSITGLELIQVNSLCAGTWPLLVNLSKELVHPVFELDSTSLTNKLSNLINEAERNNYNLSQNTEQQLQLTICATLHKLNCLALSNNQPCGLPGTGTLVGSAAPLLDLAKWHFSLVKKPALPKYRPTVAWLNFSSWTTSCLDIKQNWHKARDVESDKLQAALESDRDIKVVYSKIDKDKVWAWIHKQAKQNVSAGRLITMETLFTTPYINPLEWNTDDVDDLLEIVYNHCDTGHDILHYIQSVANNLRRQINEYNSGFSLNTSYDSPSLLIGSNDVQEKEAMNTTMKSYHTQLEDVASLADIKKPNKADYPKLIDFLRAQSQYNILVKLFNERKV